MCSDFTKRERKVIDVILRFSYGCGKKFALLTKSEIAFFANIHLSHVAKTASSLHSKHVIKQDPSNPHKYWFNKHYKNWKVAKTASRHEDFFDQVAKTASKNLRGRSQKEPETIEKNRQRVAKTASKVCRSTPPGQNHLPPGCQNGNQEVAKTASSTCQNGNLAVSQQAEITKEKHSLKTVKDSIKNNTTNNLEEVHKNEEEYSLDGYPLASNTAPPPSLAALQFLEVIKTYSEFDVRPEDVKWFEKRIDGNSTYSQLDLRDELHNWHDWLETEHRKKEKKKTNKFPKSNFKASVTNWLRKALEIRQARTKKGEQYERDGYPARKSTPFGKKKQGRKGFDLPSDYPIDSGPVPGKDY